VQFVYQDKEGNRSTREADPYGFIVSSGRIYCVAYDHARHDKRVFAIDNVSDVRVSAHTFNKPHDFDVEAFASDSISGVMHGGQATPVRVRFASRVAKAAVAARVVADRQIDRLDDGSVEIEYRVSDADELARWVLGWGSQAEVLGPPDVRNRVAALTRQIAEKYTNETKLAGV
jgi:predicted DNA-binding transcriptional regulator YafY